MIIGEVKKGKFEGAMTYTIKFCNEFINIEGYKY